MRELTFTNEDYAELLGLYLGDGHIAAGERTSRLRIAMDSKYPTIISEAVELLQRCFLDNRVAKVLAHGGTMTVVSVYSSHLACLFPQHGKGLKHRRSIVLEPWQERIVAAASWPLLRGLIRSDGCSFINRTGRYEYLSFNFANCSEGIIEIFQSACHRVGVSYRTNYSPKRKIWQVRINRRPDVALMVEHIGVKQ